MRSTRVSVAVVLALAFRAAPSTALGEEKQVTALAPPDIRWFTPSYYTDGRQRAHLLGDSTKGGEWTDRVRIPGGSQVLAHTHPTDEVVTVIEGTWYLGMGKTFDETRLTGYPAGSFIFRPAHLPHFLATKHDGAVVQVSGHDIFRTVYVDK